MPHALGQRWISDGETELGLGTIVALDQRSITLLFPATGERRQYAKTDAPVTRVRYAPGDTIESAEGWKLHVKELFEQDNLLTYAGKRIDTGETVTLNEPHLNNTIRFRKPQDRMFAGQTDRNDWFRLRTQCLQHNCDWQKSPLRGLAGGRISLVPHQLHVAHEAGKRFAPRLLLADEVGLGKTIEAGMIIHQQLLSKQAKRVLILLPESLQHQWLVEMLRRFNLHFSLFDKSRFNEAAEDSENPFDTEQLVICSTALLRDSEQRDAAADAGWDLLVVDEAHHLNWQPDEPSVEYRIVEQLANQTASVLLLTATPDQLGHESHFARLRLLDPARFHNYEAFVAEEQQFEPVANLASTLASEQPLSDEQIAQLSDILAEIDIQPMLRNLADPDTGLQAKNELLEQLIDRHGTSRVLFRNRRSAISGFPARVCRRYPLALPEQYQTAIKVNAALSKNQDPLQSLCPERIYQAIEGDNTSWWQFDPRVSWMLKVLKGELKNKKVLVICAHLNTAEHLEQALREKEGIRCSAFHEGMNLLERDRSAAWFADEDSGAQVLICSEIGSEGRNFQFAHHLIMFDLPFNPDLLEQRIGRLDRIGQTESIQIHVPYFEHTAQQRLMECFQQGLNAFQQTCPIGGKLFEQFERELLNGLRSEDGPQYQKVLEALRQQRNELMSQLEAGRDRLLEISSRGTEGAMELADSIKFQDEHPKLAGFMLAIFDMFGVQQEDSDGETLILRPTEHMLLPDFPSLPDDGVTVTFDRRVALAREDVQFLSWEHPMVYGVIELLLSSELGNNTVSLLPSSALPAGTMLVEAIYALQATAPEHFQLGRFLPATPIRQLLDNAGNNLANKVSAEGLEPQLKSVNKQTARKLVGAFQQQVHAVLQKGLPLADEQASTIVNAALSELDHSLRTEQNRLEALQETNPSVRDEEVQYVRERRHILTEALAGARVQLDSVRLIVVAPSA